MEEKNDLRVIKTKKLLYNTLEELMKEHSFEEIKVSDICTHALVNRSTFYAHYSDKYELLSEYIKTVKESIINELSKNGSENHTKDYYMDMLKLLLDYIEVKKSDYAAILVNNKNSIVTDILYDAINRDIIKQIDMMNKNDIPSEIVSKFYLGAIYNVCLDWISSKKYTKEQIMEYFEKLIPSELN